MPNCTANGLRVAASLVFLFCTACGADRPSGDRTPPESGAPQATLAERSAGRGSESERAAGAVEARVIATNLEVPWGFAFLPNGDALFTERDSGRLLRMDATGNIEQVQTLPTRGYGEGGSLGLAVSPDYEVDGYVYAYYTTEEDNRVVRFRLGEEPEPILTDIPFNSYHDGGRIAFGPDGML